MYDCEKCKAKGYLNKLPGRFCPIYRNREWDDLIGDNLPDMLYDLSEELGIDDIRILAKKFGKGVCLLGLYLTNDNIQDIMLVFNCLGGMTGTELVQLPKEGGLLEQEARWVRVFEIIRQEIVRDHARAQESNTKPVSSGGTERR